MQSLGGRKASPITQDRLQRLSVYESILNILIDELFDDLAQGGEVEEGIFVPINMHLANAPHIICSRSESRLMTGLKTPIGINPTGNDHGRPPR
jgi:hypothetical protein